MVPKMNDQRSKNIRVSDVATKFIAKIDFFFKMLTFLEMAVQNIFICGT